MSEYTIDDIHINNGNFLNRQICIPNDMAIDKATTLLNLKDICGTTHGWVYNEKLGEVTCGDDAKRKHICFLC